MKLTVRILIWLCFFVSGAISDAGFLVPDASLEMRDLAGRATEFAYDDRALRTHAVYPDGTSEEWLYDARARVEYMRSRAGGWTRYYRDGSGRELASRFLGAVRDTTDGAGTLIAAQEYDDLGNMWRRTTAGNDGSERTVTLVTDVMGRVVRRIDPASGALGAGPEVREFAYDANGNLIAMTEPAAAGETPRVVQFEYDKANRRTAVRYPASEVLVDGQPTVVQSESRTRYDELGRPLAMFDLSDATVPESGRSGRWFGYTGEGRLEAIWEQAGAQSRWTRHAYDAAGNRIETVDAMNRVNRFQYDAVGRRTARILPGSEVESTTYNAAGLPELQTLADGVSTTTHYDAAGRVHERITTVTMPGTAPVVSTVGYTYDPATGLRETATDETGTTTFVYDERGRLREKHTPLGAGLAPGDGAVLAYDWTPTGKVAAIRSNTPGGIDVAYTYDALDRLSGVHRNTGANGGAFEPVMTYGYDAHGDMAEALAGNGVRHGYTWDPMRRLRGITALQPGSETQSVASFDYALNVLGQRVRATEAVEDTVRTVDYAFDPLRRLTNEVVSTASSTAPNAPVSAVGSVGYTYDGVGNRTSRTTTGEVALALPPVPSYAYNTNDQLTNVAEIPQPGRSETDRVSGRFITDADGHVVRKIVGSGADAITIEYLVAEHTPSGHSQVVEEYTRPAAAEPLALTAVYEHGRALAASRVRNAAGEWDVRYPIADAQQSVRILTDAQGTPTDAYDYDAFGNALAQYTYGSEANPAPLPFRNEYRFAGERFDPNAQMVHLRARSYDPALGRLVGPDPFEGRITQPKTMHRYTYAQNDPVNFADPTGAFISIAGALQALEGIDGFSLALQQYERDAQLAASNTSTRAIRTVGAYLRHLQSRIGLPGREDDEDAAQTIARGIAPNVGEIMGDISLSEILRSHEREEMDLLIPPNLYEYAMRDVLAGTTSSGFYDDVVLVMNLAGGGSSTIGQLLGAVGRADIAFGTHYRRPYAGRAGLTTSLSLDTVANNMRFDRFYRVERRDPTIFQAIDEMPPRFFRTALNGRPIPDVLPTMEGESDAKAPETYIHAARLSLQHDVTDVSVAMPGGAMTLGVRRSHTSEDWDDSSGVSIEQEPDRPFGPGWSSNLAACLRIDENRAMPAPDSGDRLSPAYAYLRDETGAMFRFIVVYPATGGEEFVPLPSSNFDVDTASCSLHRSDDTYVFTRKFGTRLTFHGTNVVLTRSKVRSKYARLARIEDRFGTRVLHQYLADNQLLPSTITGVFETAPGVQSVRTITMTYEVVDGQRRVATVTDPRGSIFRYEYGALAYGTRFGDRSVRVLTSVIAPPVEAGAAVTQYEYVVDNAETALYLEKYRYDRDPAQYFHLNLTAIIDPRGHEHQFAYAYNHTYFNHYPDYGGYLPAKGKPKQLWRVTMPSLNGELEVYASFRDHSRVYADTGTDQSMAGQSRRIIEVTDLVGAKRIYDFNRFAVLRLPTIKQHLAKDLTFDENTVPVNEPEIFAFNRCRVVYPTGPVVFSLLDGRPAFECESEGREVYEFDAQSGLGVSKIQFFSGGSMTFEYGDAFEYSALNSALHAMGIAPIYARHRDVTRRTMWDRNGSNGHSRTFAYEDAADHSWRVLKRSSDELGRVTEFALNSMGQTQQETLFDANNNVLQASEYTYHSVLKTFLIRKRLLGKGDLLAAAGDPAWAITRVQEYEPDTLTGLTKKTRTHIATPSNPGALPIEVEAVYDENGDVIEQVDGRGYRTAVVHDALNQVVEMRFPDARYQGGTVGIEYAYDRAGNKVCETDENGVITEFEYDDWNRLSRTVVRMGGGTPDLVSDMHYNAVDSVVRTVDPRGTQTVYEYDALQRVKRVHQPYSYVTRFEYDERGNPGGSGLDGGSMKPTRVIDARGIETETVYDDYFRPQTVERQITAELGAAGVTRTRTDYEHDAGNNLRFTRVRRDGMILVTETQYDGLNRAVKEIRSDGVTFVTSQHTHTGLAWRAVDERGFASETEFDQAGRPIISKSPLAPLGGGGMVQPVVYAYYDANGNVVGKTDQNSGAASYVAYPQSSLYRYEYDERNRLIREIFPRVFDSTANANVEPVSDTEYDAGGHVVAQSDTYGNRTEIEYDNAYRVVRTVLPAVSVVEPNGSTVVRRPETTAIHDQNGNVIESVDPLGRVTTNEFDDLNRLIVTTDAQNITVRFAYDQVGNRTSMTDGRGRSTHFAYDGLNRVIRETDPAGRSTRMEYNELNPILSVDAEARQTRMHYDVRNRLLREEFVGRIQDDRHYTYDAASNMLSATIAGNAAANVEYTYDSLDRMATETSGGVTHTYGYDVSNNVTHVLIGGGGRLLEHGYDAQNRLVSIIEGARTTQYGYDARGLQVRQELPNGDVCGMAHDALGRVLHSVTQNGSGALIFQQITQYDALGNVRVVTETRPGGTAFNRVVVNEYDAANRLVRERVTGDGVVTTSYVYDDAHNRTQRVIVGGTKAGTTDYTSNILNQLVSWMEVRLAGTRSGTCTYDLDGNRVTKTVIDSGTGVAESSQYQYDHDHRLLAVTGADASGMPQSHAYAYDFRTRRVSRLENGTASKVIFAGGESVQERNPQNGTLTAEFIRGSDMGGGVGGLLYSVRAGETRFDHANHRGDVVVQSDPAGAITWQAAYEAFGTRTEEIGENQDLHRANSKDEDPTGLLNEGMRYRDLETGTFLTRDPAGFVDGPNLYAYVGQNPWSSYDPDGLSAVDSLVNTGMNMAGLGYDDPMRQSLNAISTSVQMRMNGGARSAKFWLKRNEARIWGGVQVAGGIAEVVGGVMGAPETAGLSLVMAAKGADHISTGLRQLQTGVHQRTMTEQIATRLARRLGASQETAGMVGVAVDIGSDLGLGALMTSRKTVVATVGRLGAEPNLCPRLANTPTVFRPVVKFLLGACFVAGTLVETEHGPKAIEQIAKDDVVLSRDVRTGQNVFAKVLGTSKRSVAETVRIRFEDRSVVEGTSDHPIWVENGQDLWSRVAGTKENTENERMTDNGRWLGLGALRFGDEALSSNGVLCRVMAMERLLRPAVVYNFEVEGSHNYFVSRVEVLVHNAPLCGPKLTRSQAQKRLYDSLGANPYDGPAQAHHIFDFVDHYSPLGLRLQNWGIDLNSIDNGVWLPNKANLDLFAAIHSGRSTSNYRNYVSIMLGSAKDKNEAVGILRYLKNELQSGFLKINRASK